MANARRVLPAVGAVLEEPAVRALLGVAPRSAVVGAVRAVIARARIGDAPAPETAEGWSQLVARELERAEVPSLRRVLNGTGVVLHTNLGRAPLATAAIEAISDIAGGASNLEYDLEAGTRGSRDTHAVDLLIELTGAEDALIVNNCAAALVLALNTLADGKDAIISRGELIEIGGSFRVPEIMTKSGARLREVGTTNRTHVDDYRRALGPGIGAIVKVHRSNFEQLGYVAEASLRALAPVAREATVPLLYDFGSGLMVDLAPFGLSGEPLARDGIRDGATLVVMSGDKLLGGPQAGIIIGSAEAVVRCRRNPLARALRLDKLRIAAMEATLRLYRDGASAVTAIPVLAMLTADAVVIRERASRAATTLASAGHRCDVVATEATVGGGAFPTARIHSFALAFSRAPEAAEAALRAAPVPLIGRLDSGRLLVDFRSLAPAEDDLAVEVLTKSLR
ncbi:MAG: L-seryl-tRNA(Sec) selenium transferase [Gemmatimonadaceae bacterium]